MDENFCSSKDVGEMECEETVHNRRTPSFCDGNLNWEGYFKTCD